MGAPRADPIWGFYTDRYKMFVAADFDRITTTPNGRRSGLDRG
jgi:hypothetical protein